MGRKDDGRTRLLHPQDLATDEFDVHGVKTGEGFVEDEEFGTMEDGRDELYLLGHPLGQLFHFLVPPALDFKTFEPDFQFTQGVRRGHAFEAGQVEGLLTDFHFSVEPAFFGQIADAIDIVRLDGTTVEQDLAGIRNRNLVHDPNHCGLAGPVRAQHSENFSLRNFDRDVVQGGKITKALDNVPTGYDVHKQVAVFGVQISDKVNKKKRHPSATTGISFCVLKPKPA